MIGWIFDHGWAIGSSVAAIGLAISTWIATNFVGKPLVEFTRIRSEVEAAIFFYANVGAADIDGLRRGSDELRRLAAQTKGITVTSATVVLWCLRRRGFDLQGAVTGLTGLSNSLGTSDGSRARYRVAVQEAFLLPVDAGDRKLVDRLRRLDDAVF